MRRVLVLFVLVGVGPSATAQEQQYAPDKLLEMQVAAINLRYADGCNKRYEMPGLFDSAKRILLKAAVDAGMPDAETNIEGAAREMAELPHKKSEGVELFDEAMCAKLELSLKEKSAP